MSDIVVVGIDAAWRWTNNSGVAVVSSRVGRWQLDCVAASYADFFKACGFSMPQSPTGVPRQMLRAGAKIGRGKVAVVAVDMPLSRQPIVGRRCADDTVNRFYSKKAAGTHSMSDPIAIRLSADLTVGFRERGFSLAAWCRRQPALVEVYPHIALIELMRAPYRLEYKIGKIGKYWRALSPMQRREQLLKVWKLIVARLRRRISDPNRFLRLPASNATGAQFKAFEDKLDAVICTYVAIEYLRGRARAYGNRDAAIWGPKPMGVNP